MVYPRNVVSPNLDLLLMAFLLGSVFKLGCFGDETLRLFIIGVSFSFNKVTHKQN